VRRRRFVKLAVCFIVFALWLFITGHTTLVGVAVIGGTPFVWAALNRGHLSRSRSPL
jgi:hypothetical protein